MKNLATILFVITGSVITLGQINFELEMFNVVSKENTSISQMSSKSKGVVIIFMSNECPFSSQYINRLKSIENDYKEKGVSVILVNSFLPRDESLEEMNAFAKKYKLSNYLTDKDQLFKKAIGARKSPEAFLFKRGGSKFTLFYKGPIDSNAQMENDVKSHYLTDNIDNLLVGKQAIKSGSPVMGCVIK